MPYGASDIFAPQASGSLPYRPRALCTSPRLHRVVQFGGVTPATTREAKEDNAGSLVRCGRPPLSTIDTLVPESTIPLEGLHHAPLTFRLGLLFELNDLETLLDVTPQLRCLHLLSLSEAPLPLCLAALCGSTGVDGRRWNALTELEVLNWTKKCAASP